MDRITKKQRSDLMSRIRGKDTSIEMAFRKYLWTRGIRGYRIHAKVPGSPDIYFPKRRFAVFIDGCFWHGCAKCFRKPKSNIRYWNKKIRDNIERDRRKDKDLRLRNIGYMHIWEHEINGKPAAAYGKFKKRFAASKTRKNVAE